MSALESACTVIKRLRDHGHIALLAGGCVRDRLLGRTPTDYDVATDAPPPRICRIFRRTKQVGAQFGVVLVRIGGDELEVATFRTDGSYRDGRRPESVEFTTPQEDARRRDFTINGMFLDPLTDEVVDYVGGQQDLANRVVRCIGTPEARFAEDHLRMLRAVRFAARLGFAIEAETHAAIQRLAPRISAISAERIRMELELILTAATRADGWRLLRETELVNHLVAGVTWDEANGERCGRILAALPERVSDALAFAAIFVELDEPGVERACAALRCSTAVSRAASYLVRMGRSVQRGEVRELADVKFLLVSGHADEALALGRALASVDGCGSADVEALAQRAAGIAPEDYAPPPFVTGEDLIALKVAPGPRYREILDALYRAQLNDELTTRAAAEARMKQMVADGG